MSNTVIRDYVIVRTSFGESFTYTLDALSSIGSARWRMCECGIESLPILRDGVETGRRLHAEVNGVLKFLDR